MLPIVFKGAQHLGSSLILLQGQPNLLGQKQTPLPIPPLREPLERRGKSTKRYLMRLPIQSLHPHPEQMTPHQYMMN